MDKIIQILSQIRPEADYKRSTDYMADGLLDSFDIVTLVSDLDQAFGISIAGTDIVPDHFRNAEAIAALLGRYQVTL